MANYSYNIAWSPTDSAYIALSAEFPGLSGIGETPDEALRELTVAIDLAEETLREAGQPLPQPHHLIAYSGQFRLRLPKSLHRSLSLRAEAEGISLNTLVVSLVIDSLSRTEAYRSIVREYAFLADTWQTCRQLLAHCQRETSETTDFASTALQDPLLRRLYAPKP